MSEVVLVAIAAAIGNFLQGWDNSALAGKYLSQIKYACLLKYIYIYIYTYFQNLLPINPILYIYIVALG